MMCKRLWALPLSLFLLLACACSGLGASHEAAASIGELRALLSAADAGDVILIKGEIACGDSAPLTCAVPVRITSDGHDPATLRGLRLQDASISFSDIHLADALSIAGASHVQLLRGAVVTGSEGRAALSFSGSGTLIAERGSSIAGGPGSDGVSIRHSGGEFYASLEGSVSGGGGYTGGHGVVVSPLGVGGAMMITGGVRGGEGEVMGGNALNLYDLNSNAYVTVDGQLHGGAGSIGGDGIQLVSATGSVNVGISGRVSGGSGSIYGGDAIMLMNAEGASSIHLYGEFSGGNATSPEAQPGTALVMVGPVTSMRTRVSDCMLEDGRRMLATDVPPSRVTPLPEIQSSTEEIDVLEPIDSTALPMPEPTPMPTIEPQADTTPEPEREATPGEAA